MLEAVVDDPTSSEAVGERLSKRLLRLTGRPIGMFMANAIEEAFGREHIKTLVGNPFAFMRSYAKAAAQDPALPAISPKAMKVIDGWEQQYLTARGETCGTGFQPVFAPVRNRCHNRSADFCHRLLR